MQNHKVINSGCSALSKTVLVSVLLASASPVMAKQRIDQTIETSSQPNVEIEHVNGKAVIKTWDKNAVKITGDLSDKTEDFEFEKTASGVSFDVDIGRHQGDWGNYRIKDGDDLTIYVPAASKIDYSAVSASVQLFDITNDTKVDLVNGDIEANNLAGRIKLETVNGNVKLNAVKGELVAETVNGDIKGDHSEGEEARITTVNGNIDIRSDSPQLRIESVNGRMDFTTAMINELDIVTVNGKVRGDITLADNGDVDVSSVGGKVTLIFQPVVSARFDIQAHAGGDIRNSLTSDKSQKAKYGPNEWLEFSTGKGSARVEVSTVHGVIELNKR
ncbi:DUF4097 family beta strand repeat protein [Salinimonas sp. HHU 13199]|uniref:DUF4097 family beta strand repeat protein n=1 Tax=Salinimonas profundi TaxID=2729140 RepID=A0ABR8LN96_9ALTE|nr:DUF4097 family beta strand repeat-containing protein [Salinimonas profundi]MBD3586376.1 DUF4097 family beta strand repeat protein [Salinimonas profundi]